MLIEKQPEVNDIVTIKLASGEEVVGKLTNRQIDSVSLAKPIKIQMQSIPGTGQVGLQFVPFMGSVHDATVQFPLSALLTRPVRTGEDVRNNYIQATSNIVTATPEQAAGILLP